MNNNDVNNNQPTTISNPEISVETPNVVNVTPEPIQQNQTIEPKKNNKNIIFIILGIIVVAIIAACLYFFLIKEDDNDNNANNNEIKENENKDNSEKVDGNSWIGTYTNGEYTITIYIGLYDELNIDINTENSNVGFSVEDFTNEKIEFNDSFFGEETNVTIEKVNNSVKVTASSSDEDSILNSASGDYPKNEFTEYGWTGTYTYENIKVMLAEVDENKIICNISKEDDDSIATNLFTIDEVSSDTLHYESTFDKEIVTINKNDNGISINASTDEENGLLNQINGNYTKK